MKELEKIAGAFSPKDRIEYSKGSIVSQQITKNQSGNLTLFAFDEVQQLSEHTAPFDAIVQILDGEAEIQIDSDLNYLTKGQMIIMPANIPHALYAKKQ